MQPIVDMGAVTTRTARGTVYCLTVIGQIEGHSLLPNTVKTTKYEHVLPLLAALDESEEIDGVLLLLNTCGGDVEAGLAIAELIAGMRKPTGFGSCSAGDTPSACRWPLRRSARSSRRARP